MGKPTNQILLSVLLLQLLACLTPPSLLPTAAAQCGITGQLQVVPDVKNNKEIQALGKYTVDDYNSKQKHLGFAGNPLLVYTEVVAAQSQVVAGTKYYLMILASQRIFHAEVVVQSWAGAREVISFTPS